MLIWDETKRRRNIALHGIDFASLGDIFSQPTDAEVDDGPHSELRYRTYFLHQGRVAALIWIERGRHARAISCWYVNRARARKFIEENFH
ncbi:BrnT family toxin [Massilia sp. SM-13]|uniref:BrnT family toxin n=1 Tax=Pseudoduganella rhizocola TaxID=3382643 RepID=UPI0038B5BFF7